MTDRPAPAHPIQPCVRCGAPMSAIKGSKAAVCTRCGYKDDCC
ncbi:MAG TPA: hypothetical protein VIO14_07200 [Dehalococcoidia bacterium]